MKKIYTLLLVSVAYISGAYAQSVSITANSGFSGNAIVGAQASHVTEAIYTETEIGAANFTTAQTAINRIAFNTDVGSTATFPITITGYNIYMREVPAATTTFTAGTYSLSGYTLVYSGSITFSSVTSWTNVDLTTPFLRTAGNNLSLLVIRTNTVAQPGVNIVTAGGNNVSATANTTRRYNAAAAPAENSTSLTASTFRPAIQLIRTSPIDASLSTLRPPLVSCVSTGNFSVTLTNAGTSAIASGAASVTLSTPNSSVLATPVVVSNSASIAPNASVVLNFNNVPVGPIGTTGFRTVVALAGDTNAANDTAVANTNRATILTSFPQTEDAESTLPVVKWISAISGSRNLWTLEQDGYANVDMPDSLAPAGGRRFFLADCYSGANSSGFRSRLYSECLQIPTQSGGLNYNVSFQMSQDNKFATDLDSIYVMVSTNGGVDWTSIGGFQRYNAAFTLPGWVTNNVSLTAYAGQTIQIGFDAVSKFGNVIGLDNIVITANTALPVTFSSFTGTKRGNVNDLVWVTANETNNAGFEIERSADGRTFSKIAFVATKATNGSSNQAISYTATDAFVLAGTNHYRLKQVDKDGKFNYSAVVTINGARPGKLSLGTVYPNPAVDVVNLQIATPNSVTAQIVILGANGNIVAQHNKGLAAGDNLITLPVQNLAKGTYFVRVIDNNGDYTNTVQFVK